MHGKGAFKYDNVRIGWNSRLDTIQAAILQVKFKAFAEYELKNINSVAEQYTKELEGIVKVPRIKEGFYSSWAQYTIQLESKKQRDDLQAYLKEVGIPTMVYYPKPMHMQTAFSGNKEYVDCSVTEKLCETVLSLPIHPYMQENDIQILVDRVKCFLLN